MTQSSPLPSVAASPRWLWPAAAGLLALLALGLGALWWVNRMPTDNDPAVTFARDMMAHHQQAVEMALIIRDRSTDEAFRQFTLDVILTQQAQIGQMQGWLGAWGLPYAGAEAPMTGPMVHNGQTMAMTPELMGMQPQDKVNALRTTEPVVDAEVAFLQMMIGHHQGGILMAEAALEQSQHPEVRRLAESVITAQTGEIAYMRTLLQQRGVAP